jgi:hypothetical protein
MERYFNAMIREYINSGKEELDENARNLESTKRGGFGSGFVYLDKDGNNYIITNYHVVVGGYRFSATFESERNERRVYQNLSIHSVNEDWDLAILAFPEGQKPFTKGLTLSTAALSSGSTVTAAGYPGVEHIPSWSFFPGFVGNAHMTLPRQKDWFIQHNAPINPGNSGGPLLIADTTAQLKYSVVGVNTFYRRDIAQGANFSIPAERVEAFIRNSLIQTNLEDRINSFMELLVRSTTSEYVYDYLASFLSSTMINGDPATAVSDAGGDFKKMVEEDPINGITKAVAFYQIENLIYRKSGRQLAQKTSPELLSIEPNNMGGYTARLLVNGYPYRTDWVKEYGTWKLDAFIEDDGEYNDYQLFATAHPLGKKVIYSFSSALDVDWYVLDIPRAGKLTVRTEGNLTDPVISIADAQLNQLAKNDDYAGRGLNALVTVNADAGKIYVVVSMAEGGKPGEYILLAGLDNELDNILDTALPITVYNGPSITIVNNTGYPVTDVRVSPVTHDTWGENRLPGNQTLRNGQSVSVQLPYELTQVDQYDIRLTDTDDDKYIKNNLRVSANGRIEFTMRDIVSN